VINQVMTDQKVLALTFDDGPTKTWTPQVLSVLKRDHIRATFFVIGSHAQRRPDILGEEAKAGMEIGSHGFQHLVLRHREAATVAAEIRANEALFAQLGVPQPTLYRLPGGASDRTARAVLGQMGYQVIGWTIDTRDWRRRYTGLEMANHVVHDVTPGCIVIFHDGPNSSAATVDAVARLIPALKQQGWRFDTVSQLLKLEHPRRVR
jgi:peptidoglycan/xylan/chitin deacetylase (PgdA/CDA1 family)